MQSASLMTARRINNFWWWRRPLMCTCKIYTQQPTEMVCVQCKMRVYTWWMWCAYRCKEDNLESMRWRQQSQSWNEKLIDEMIETPPKTIRRRPIYTLSFRFVVCAPHNVRYTFSLVSTHEGERQQQKIKREPKIALCPGQDVRVLICLTGICACSRFDSYLGSFQWYLVNWTRLLRTKAQPSHRHNGNTNSRHTHTPIEREKKMKTTTKRWHNGKANKQYHISKIKSMSKLQNTLFNWRAKVYLIGSVLFFCLNKSFVWFVGVYCFAPIFCFWSETETERMGERERGSIRRRDETHRTRANRKERM